MGNDVIDIHDRILLYLPQGKQIPVFNAMARRERQSPAFVKSTCEQLEISREDLVRETRVSFAAVTRWEKGQAMPSRLVKAQLDAFCTRMTEERKPKILGKDK